MKEKLKERIKELAAEQLENKKGRKGEDAPYCQSEVATNKPRITAALNLYHEIRGSEYRHNVREEHSWSYSYHYKKLKGWLEEPPQKEVQTSKPRSFIAKLFNK